MLYVDNCRVIWDLGLGLGRGGLLFNAEVSNVAGLEEDEPGQSRCSAVGQRQSKSLAMDTTYSQTPSEGGISLAGSPLRPSEPKLLTFSRDRVAAAGSMETRVPRYLMSLWRQRRKEGLGQSSTSVGLALVSDEDLPLTPM